MKKYFLVILVILSLSSCVDRNLKQGYNTEQEHIVLATLWFQHSPEVEALYYQGFNLAKERVLEFKKEPGEKPKAVVVDLDETMIDNSAFQGKMIETGKRFSPEFWSEWSKLEEAKATSGAVEFTHFCKKHGVEVIYLSNRMVDELEATMNNMQKLGFAFLKPENYFLMDTTSGKEPRRDLISEKFDIILLLGDNLNDFSNVFEERKENWGRSAVEENKDIFGKRFIVFPNPMYGEWEKNIYDFKRNIDEKERFVLRRKKIASY